MSERWKRKGAMFKMNTTMICRHGAVAGAVWAALMLGGCGMVVNRVSNQFAENLTQAVMNHDDLKTVEQGAPAYLLLMDSMIESDPENTDMLASAAGLYSSYATVFVTDEARAKRLTERAHDYGNQALCLLDEQLCNPNDMAYDAYAAAISHLQKGHMQVLYAASSAWAGWIQTHQDDWNAIAQIPKVKALVTRMAALDPTYQHGAAYLYLGVLESLLPPAAGGKPEVAKKNFEKADALAGGHNLMVKVMMAENYARMMFDRDLHDKLLHEVLAADPHYPDFTLMNMLAQKRAKELLASADDYF